MESCKTLNYKIPLPTSQKTYLFYTVNRGTGTAKPFVAPESVQGFCGFHCLIFNLLCSAL